jgi:hypothetical protein
MVMHQFFLILSELSQSGLCTFRKQDHIFSIKINTCGIENIRLIPLFSIYMYGKITCKTQKNTKMKTTKNVYSHSTSSRTNNFINIYRIDIYISSIFTAGCTYRIYVSLSYKQRTILNRYLLQSRWVPTNHLQYRKFRFLPLHYIYLVSVL